jgi:hypothetical protein
MSRTLEKARGCESVRHTLAEIRRNHTPLDAVQLAGTQCRSLPQRSLRGGVMDSAAVDDIRQAVRAVHKAVHTKKLDSCDIDDIDEVISAVDLELARPHPNKNTLATYLSSLERSLRAEPHTHDAYGQLDDAMRNAGIPEI